MRRDAAANRAALVVAGALLATLFAASAFAPSELGFADTSAKYLSPLEAPPFGTDRLGIPLHRYALQGAHIVALPAVVSGLCVGALAVIAGLVRCANLPWADTALQAFSELVGALPRLVVVLVVALAVPKEWRSLFPIGLTWALLAAPGAMDEAAATAERLGGARFVEALRAHGFSAPRIFVYHIIWLNLRSVIARQSAEVAMQVVFLEIALSYLAASRNEPSFTTAETKLNSWAVLLYEGYTAIVAGVPMGHALVVGVSLVAIVALMSQAVRLAARPR